MRFVESPSMDDLRSRTTPPTLSRSHSMPDVSNFAAVRLPHQSLAVALMDSQDLSNEYLRQALERARATMNEYVAPLLLDNIDLTSSMKAEAS
jgi:hypothetical protein